MQQLRLVASMRWQGGVDERPPTVPGERRDVSELLVHRSERRVYFNCVSGLHHIDLAAGAQLLTEGDGEEAETVRSYRFVDALMGADGDADRLGLGADLTFEAELLVPHPTESEEVSEAFVDLTTSRAVGPLMLSTNPTTLTFQCKTHQHVIAADARVEVVDHASNIVAVRRLGTMALHDSDPNCTRKSAREILDEAKPWEYSTTTLDELIARREELRDNDA